ncbi:MAG: glycoside hydrolase family 3 C-terminal domain-containing protein, partial [Ilumatobacteraceae bacterium]
VMLRNDGLLPIDPARTGRVAVLGRLAAMRNLGDGGSSDVKASDVVTPLDGLRRVFGNEMVDHHESDLDIVDVADVVVVVVGYTKDDEGEYIDNTGTAPLVVELFPPMDHPTLGTDAPHERPGPTGRVRPDTGGSVPNDDSGAMAPGGDRASLRLSAADESMIAAATARHRRVVVVVVTGSAVVTPWVDSVSATLVTWYAGVEGGDALAEIVTGRAEPGGRLPFAIPLDPDDLVGFDRNATVARYDLFHGQWKLDRDGRPAHFPFGWGLGYGRAHIERAEPIDAGSIRVTVTNASPSDTTVVVFAFAGLDASVHERPHRRLVGFARRRLGAGTSDPIDLLLDWSAIDLRFDGAWVTEPGRYVVDVGLHAHDPDAISLVFDRH